MKIAKMATDHCCVPFSVIKTKGRLVVKISLTLIFQGISRNKSANHF